MKILILNGSPKGENSITYQTCLYIQELFPDNVWECENVGQKIVRISRNPDEIIEKINNSDLLIFSYPVYTFIAPYQLHLFIEILKNRNVDLSDKFVTQITTSKHFYDMTAHKFIEENCLDMGAKVIKGLSADMEDLIKDEGQKDTEMFFRKIIHDIENEIYIERAIKKQTEIKDYVSMYSQNSIKKNTSKRICIVACLTEEKDNNLKNMVDDFVALSPYDCDIVNLNNFNFDGGCIGCFKCAFTGDCFYGDRFQTLLRDRIQTADAIIYAFTIKNHYADAIMKCYDDRQFCNGHRTVMKGTPVGYILSGAYSTESNLQTIIEARAEVGGTYLSGVATDEYSPEKSIKSLISNLVFAIENHMECPANFYGIGGMKIFRDLIFEMQGLMEEDHRYYKKTGVYDFPQKKLKKIIMMKIIGKLLRNPEIQKKIRGNMTKYMLEPYKKVIGRAKK